MFGEELIKRIGSTKSVEKRVRLNLLLNESFHQDHVNDSLVLQPNSVQLLTYTPLNLETHRHTYNL